jgi:glycolate oxidase subunit GlcD
MSYEKNIVIKELEKIVGKKNLISDEKSLMPYRYAAIASGISPRMVIFPENTEQVSGVMKILHKYKIPVIPRGAGTNLNGGTVPLEDAAVLEMAKMNKVIEVDIDNNYILVEAGATNLEVQEELEPYGYFYAPDPASQSVSSIAGNIAENAGGPRCVKYGVTANNVIGMEVVLSDGKVYVLNGPLQQEQGYNLTGIMHASEGAFGIITKAWLKIMKKPEAVKTLLAIFNTLEDAAKTVSQIIAKGIIPTTLELIDNPVLRAVEESEKIGYSLDAAAVLLIEIDGYEASMDSQAQKIIQVCQENNVRETKIAQTEREREKLWWGRRTAGSCLGRLKPAYAEEDVTIPRTKLPEMLKTIENIAKKYDLIIGNVFHAGDGNFHPEIVYDDRDEEETKRVEIANEEIMQEAAKLGGTITGEHGVGIEKLKGMPLIFSNDDMSFMWKLKQAFDPVELLNIGKVIPENIIKETVKEKERINKTKDKEKFIKTLKNKKNFEVSFDEKTINKYVLNDKKPWCIVKPKNENEVAEIVKLARDCNVKIFPWGQGTKRHSIKSICELDVIINLSNLNQILEVDTGNFTVTVEAGVKLEVLQSCLNEKNMLIPLDPLESGCPTLGGIVASNSTGSLRQNYGNIKDLILEVEFISSEGKIIHYGGKTLKNVAGFDLNKLMVNSWGTLGILTKVTFKLYPLPESLFYRTYFSTNFDIFKNFFKKLQQSDIEPISLDVTVSRSNYYINVCIGGPKESVQKQLKELDEIKGIGIKLLKEIEDRKIYYGKSFTQQKISKGIYAPDQLVIKSSILPADVIKWMETIYDFLDKTDTVIYGHALNGIMYFIFSEGNEKKMLDQFIEKASYFNQNFRWAKHFVISGNNIDINKIKKDPKTIIYKKIKDNLDREHVFVADCFLGGALV